MPASGRSVRYRRARHRNQRSALALRPPCGPELLQILGDHLPHGLSDKTKLRWGIPLVLGLSLAQEGQVGLHESDLEGCRDVDLRATPGDQIVELLFRQARSAMQGNRNRDREIG